VVNDTEEIRGVDWLADEPDPVRRDLLPAQASRDLVLALDQGGTSSRAVLFDAAGLQVAAAHVPVGTRRDGDDRVEHDADELVHSLVLATRDVCASAPARRPIVAAGLATQRSTVCCWDRSDGEALAPAISWQDRRNADWLHEHLGSRAQWVREVTGLPLSPHYGAAKLRWCLDHVPAVRIALREERLALGPLASFLLHRLCAEAPLAVDPANASRTLLYDPTTLAWSPALLDAFGIDGHLLPDCVGTEHAFGVLGVDVGPRVPMRACSGDQSAALFAFGPPSTSTALVNVGTGAFVQRAVTADAGRAPAGLLTSVVHADPRVPSSAWLCHEGTVNGAASALEWLGRRVALDVGRAFNTLTVDAARTRHSLSFINGVGGLGAPYWRADFPVEFVDAEGRSLGDAPGNDDRERLAAVLDSVAFLIAVNLASMQQTAPLQRVTITGGLAASDYLCTVLADACGLPVARPTQHEATARGIAWLAAGRPAHWEPVPIERTFQPSGGRDAGERYARWQAAMNARGAG
jgi:glycerol kinase